MIAMPKGKMTLEKLAVMVQEALFANEESLKRYIDKRFAAIERRLDAIESRLDSLEAEVSSIRRQLDQAVYQHEFNALEQRVEELERKAGIRP